MVYDKKYYRFKSVRDPLYGFIHISKRETALIGTPFIHRLTRIKQLAHSYLVYPSAVHSRFEHSLGVLHMADRLCSCFEVDNERREVIRCAALLHDMGHGPFSHLFENIMVQVNGDEFTHEDVTRAIIQYDESVKNILQGNFELGTGNSFSDIHAKVLALLGKDSSETDPLGRSIISGTIDADKLDYLRRDSFHTGSTYGVFDLERMLSTLTTVKEDDKEYPCILEKGTPVLESFRLARYLLYMQVYQHHTRLAADRMMLRALELALFTEKKIPMDYFQFKDREKDFINSYLMLDDYSIYELVLNNCRDDPNSTAFQIMNDLKNRRLFKRGFERELNAIPATKRMKVWKMDERTMDKEIASTATVPQEFIICHKESDEGGLKSYKTFGRVTEAGDIPIMYIDKEGKPQNYDDRSPISLQKESSQMLYVFTKNEYREKVAKACDKKFC